MNEQIYTFLRSLFTLMTRPWNQHTINEQLWTVKEINNGCSEMFSSDFRHNMINKLNVTTR